MADSGEMWLRDFLPYEEAFKKSRILTFGYTSTLVDKKKLNDRFENYADELIKGLIRLRGSTTEQTRPLIFICHSMGGLVARIAMTRIQTLPSQFNGLSLKECGLLFLSTPHLGSEEANQNPFLMALAQGLIGFRSGIVKELQTFKVSSVDITNIFKEMPVKPSLVLFCESEPTLIAGKLREVRILHSQPNSN